MMSNWPLAEYEEAQIEELMLLVSLLTEATLKN